MDKVKKFLEAYVQWVAVALGVAFLGWTIYGYIILKPVTVSVGPAQDVTPADVSGKIWTEAGEPLAQLVKGTSVPAVGSDGEIAKVVLNPFTDPGGRWPVLPNPYTPIPIADTFGSTAPVEDQQQKGVKITRLPEAPAPTGIVISHGHSNVPGPQILGAAGAPAATVQAVDRNWISVEAVLHTADLAKSFKASGIEPGSPFSSTAVLRVELIRQQMGVDGNWSAETEIPPLDINSLPPLPDQMVDFSTQKDYFDFAEKNPVPIIQPPFYQVLQGNVWYEPGLKNPNEVETTAEDTFDTKDPGAYAGDPTKLLPSERKLYDEAKARQAAKDAAKSRAHQGGTPPNNNQSPPGLPGLPGAPGNGPGGGGGSGHGTGNRSGMAPDPQRPPDNSFRPPGFFGGGPGTGPYGAPPPMPGFPGGAQPGQQSTNGGALPAGSFDPSVQVDFKMWAHDPTAQAGKTYRYKLRYVISNPVARTTGLCNPEDLSKQFYIVSKDSAWTESINVESDANFFAVDLKHGVHFDVFKWEKGVWQMQSVTVNPGDTVGTTETNPAIGVKTDFATGWTLVDIREDPNNNDNRTLVLVSDNGTVIKKDLLTDAHSAEYRKLYLLAMANRPAAAAAGTPANGLR